MRIKKLTEQQKEAVMNEWNDRPTNPPSLLDLIPVAGFEGKDVRKKEGRAVKAFLASKEIRALGAHEYQPKPEVVLTEECIDLGSNPIMVYRQDDELYMSVKFQIVYKLREQLIKDMLTTLPYTGLEEN